MNSAGIVVLYDPDQEVIKNILSWSNEVDYVYLIDNSKADHKKMFHIKNAKYFHMKRNIGLCGGMNYGCRKAIHDRERIDCFVAMNQDTWAAEGEISKLLNAADRKERAVYGTNFKYIYRHKGRRVFSNESAYHDNRESVFWVIMAGCAFSSSAFLESGGFDEKLFIDHLDIDFCLKLRKKKYEIVRLGDIYIYQEPGNTVKKKIGNRILHISNLNPKRRYLTFRNERYLRRKWKDDYTEYRLKLYKEIISIVFFEANKIEKLLSCLKGWNDGLNY